MHITPTVIRHLRVPPLIKTKGVKPGVLRSKCFLLHMRHPSCKQTFIVKSVNICPPEVLFSLQYSNFSGVDIQVDIGGFTRFFIDIFCPVCMCQEDAPC